MLAGEQRWTDYSGLGWGVQGRGGRRMRKRMGALHLLMHAATFSETNGSFDNGDAKDRVSTTVTCMQLLEAQGNAVDAEDTVAQYEMPMVNVHNRVAERADDTHVADAGAQRASHKSLSSKTSAPDAKRGERRSAHRKETIPGRRAAGGPLTPHNRILFNALQAKQATEASRDARSQDNVCQGLWRPRPRTHEGARREGRIWQFQACGVHTCEKQPFRVGPLWKSCARNG